MKGYLDLLVATFLTYLVIKESPKLLGENLLWIYPFMLGLMGIVIAFALLPYVILSGYGGSWITKSSSREIKIVVPTLIVLGAFYIIPASMQWYRRSLVSIGLDPYRVIVVFAVISIALMMYVALSGRSGKLLAATVTIPLYFIVVSIWIFLLTTAYYAVYKLALLTGLSTISSILEEYRGLLPTYILYASLIVSFIDTVLGNFSKKIYEGGEPGVLSFRSYLLHSVLHRFSVAYVFEVPSSLFTLHKKVLSRIMKG